MIHAYDVSTKHKNTLDQHETNYSSLRLLSSQPMVQISLKTRYSTSTLLSEIGTNSGCQIATCGEILTSPLQCELFDHRSFKSLIVYMVL